MAEIRVRPKPRNLTWLWVLLALVVLALVAWYLVNTGMIHLNASTAPRTAVAPARAVQPLLWS